MNGASPPPKGQTLDDLLLQAATDPAFRKRLLEDPLAAASQWGFTLKPAAQAMLAAMDRSQLGCLLDALAQQARAAPPAPPAPPAENVPTVTSAGISP